MTQEDIDQALRERPEPIDPTRWTGMDPAVRDRFHEFGNHISRLEGVIAGLSMRTPPKPETLPMLEREVEYVKQSQLNLRSEVSDFRRELSGELKGLRDDVAGLTLRVVAGSSVLTAIVTAGVQVAMK